MARTVYHTELGIILYLNSEDLGHPDIPGLWEIVRNQPYEPGRLYCADPHNGGIACPGRMYLREQPVPGGIVRQAVHVHEGSPPEVRAEESERHKALKERIATAAQRAGFPADIESRAAHGRRRTDVLIHGASGHLLGAEAQISQITAGTVKRRTKIARNDGITPVWVCDDPYHQAINRAPWARIGEKKSWRELLNNRDLLVEGGVYHLQAEKCDERRPRPCPDRGYGRCGKWHPEFHLATGVYLDHLIGAAAANDMVDIRDGANFRWVNAAERSRYWDLIGGPINDDETEDPKADAPTIFTDEEPSLKCTYGTNDYVKAPRRTLRDTGHAPYVAPVARPTSAIGRVAAALDGTPRSLAEIAKRSGVAWLGDTSRHLERLVSQGRATRVGTDRWMSTR